MFAPKIFKVFRFTNDIIFFPLILEVSHRMAKRNETMTNLGETRLILKILLDWWMNEKEKKKKKKEILSKDKS